MTTTLPAGWKPIESAPKNQLVMVYTPPQPSDWPDSVRIGFDYIDPEVADDYWYNHGEHYEHYCCVAKPENCTGPQERAPYTHWQPMPEPPCQTCNDQGAVGNILTAEPCPDCTPPASAQDDTLARTGNTADHQEGWYAGVDHARAEARAGAQDDAKEYGSPARILRQFLSADGFIAESDIPEICARLRPDAPAAGDARAMPELNADLIGILGRPNFACIHIAQLLRRSGVEIDKKAEAEQATVIHYLMGFYLKHGSQWVEKAGEDLERLRLAAIAAQQGSQGGK